LPKRRPARPTSPPGVSAANPAEGGTRLGFAQTGGRARALPQLRRLQLFAQQLGLAVGNRAALAVGVALQVLLVRGQRIALAAESPVGIAEADQRLRIAAARGGAEVVERLTRLAALERDVAEPDLGPRHP